MLTPYVKPQVDSSRNSQMKAFVHDRYGAAGVLADIEVPTIDDDDVLVRVRAASVNAADPAIIRGKPYILRLGFGLVRPKSRARGMDVAGVVEAVGKNVTRFQLGDEVFGVARGALPTTPWRPRTSWRSNPPTSLLARQQPSQWRAPPLFRDCATWRR